MSKYMKHSLSVLPRRKAGLFFFYAAFFILLLSVPLETAQNWVKETSTKEGITIYSRSTPGTNIRELKASIHITAPPETVHTAVCDPETYTKTSSKYVVERQAYPGTNPNNWYVYQRVKYPFVDMRDYTIRYEKLENIQQRVYQLKWQTSTQNQKPPQKNVVRMKTLNGAITIKPHTDGKSSIVHYTIIADPGGSIPAWIINLASRKSLPDILRQIRAASLRLNSKTQAL